MDRVSKEKRSEIMSRIRGKRTGPEMKFHGILKGWKIPHKMWPEMEGRPDVFIYPWMGEPGVCVFVNGCFWHGCREHFRLPKTNKRFWREKIGRNVERQRESARELRRMGFGVLVVWEHELVGKKLNNKKS